MRVGTRVGAKVEAGVGMRVGIDGFRRLARLGAGLSILLWLAAAQIGATGVGAGDGPLRECREVGRICSQAARADARVCLDGCEAGETGDTCRTECRVAYGEAQVSCRMEVHECAQASRPPLDEVCVEECRAEFAADFEELRACKGDCRADLRAAVAACRIDLAGDAEALRTCISEARKVARLCAQDCHDELPCATELRSCLEGCVIE